jgi:hypothetical protein
VAGACSDWVGPGQRGRGRSSGSLTFGVIYLSTGIHVVASWCAPLVFVIS